ncbi:hypothetical protein HELRODRAFT_66918 [Helobdella robusta]|uniref:ubiquitinyl hydrolase 1 n=1 Tax=Helobdella robusta TaxID=6412 RepID=T1FYS9_HELRO|nr:hypothetical protein HELRODRAFT_66918 [Helobdella robusta]ESN99029.1 hypothetical protein HELRODRAFT_66918 [Helobdella robusta]
MMDQKIYHEKQRLSLCALHCLNNLLQKEVFTKAILDETCEKLTDKKWFNPHRSYIGTGNYDVNVIMSALESINYSITWFDRRKSYTEVDWNNIFGIIVNCKSSFFTYGPINIPSPRKHWFAVRKLSDNLFYNLDSKLNSPQVIGTADQLIEFLNEKSSCDISILIVNKSPV